MKTVGLAEVLLYHQKIVERTGGTAGVRDIGLIKSTLSSAFSMFDGEALYPSTEDKISIITYTLISNHGFVDGNKRLGVAVMLLLLQMNNIRLIYKQDELVELGLGIASGQLKMNHIKEWIEKHRTS